MNEKIEKVNRKGKFTEMTVNEHYRKYRKT